MEEKIRFGKRLKLCRETLWPKKTQEEVANDLGISRNYLSNLENDQGQPSHEMLAQLINYYGASFDFVFGYQKKVVSPAHVVRERGVTFSHSIIDELLEIIWNMSERKLRIALAVIRAIDEVEPEE